MGISSNFSLKSLIPDSMKYFVLIFIAAIGLLSCDGIQSTVNVRVEVRDIETWTPDDPVCSVAKGAFISVFEYTGDGNPGNYQNETTDQNGNASFDLDKNTTYCLVASMGSRSNVLSMETRNGVSVGYIVVDVFNSQADADSHASFPGMSLGAGDPRILDLNSDGVITVDDKLPGYQFTTENNLYLTIFITESAAFE
jgi:hypothetical protein